MGLPIRILVRTDVDWRGMSSDDFGAQTDRTRPLKFILTPEASAAVELWDRVFAVDFFTYRAETRDVAEASLAAAGADHVTVGFDAFDPVGGFDAWWASPEDEIVVPIDDDDLVTPALPLLAAELDGDAGVALWPRAAFGVDDRGTAVWTAPPLRIAFATNCALRKSFLTANFSAADGRRLLADHRLANERVAGALGLLGGRRSVEGFHALRHPRVAYVDRWFSLKNAHAGSIQFLVNAMRRPDPAAFLSRLDLRVPRPYPEGAAAVAAHLDALDRLWASLRAGAASAHADHP